MRHRAVFLLSALAIAWSGCTIIRMAAPAGLVGGGEEFSSDRPTFEWSTGMITVGPYLVTDFAKGHGHAKRSGSSQTDQGAFSFRFREGEEALDAQCSQTKVQSTSALWGTITMSSSSWRLDCRCGEATLEIGGDGGETQGRAMLGGIPLVVRSAHDYDNGARSSDPLGFSVEAGGVALGSVETRRPERIWLARDLDPDSRRHVACLLAGFFFLDTRTDHDAFE